MPIDETHLCTTWSADAPVTPGAPSDDRITFFADGTGLFEVLDWGFGSVTLFRWELAPSGELSIAAEAVYAVRPETLEAAFVGPREFRYASSEATIADEVSWNGKQWRMLRLPGFGALVRLGARVDVYGLDPSVAPRAYELVGAPG